MDPEEFFDLMDAVIAAFNALLDTEELAIAQLERSDG